MRSHIRTLARVSINEHGRSLDYVIMFVSEGALAAALQMAADLTHIAMNIVVIAPTTLMIALVIANVWRVERRNRVPSHR